MKVQRNDKCVCGSGKKFKKCCMAIIGENKIEIPDFITCNECGGKSLISTYEFLDTRDMEGINMAISSICEKCGAPSISASGDPEMVALLMEHLSEDMNVGNFNIN